MKRIFESENISFVEPSEELAADYLLMVNDTENVGRFFGYPHEPYTREDEIAWVRKKLAEKAAVFSMIEKKSGEFIGNIEFMNVQSGEGELGIALTASKMNMGYGTEAVTAFVKYGREDLGLERIHLRTAPANARAIRVYEKCGFREYDRTDVHVCMEYIPG